MGIPSHGIGHTKQSGVLGGGRDRDPTLGATIRHAHRVQHADTPIYWCVLLLDGSIALLVCLVHIGGPQKVEI